MYQPPSIQIEQLEDSTVVVLDSESRDAVLAETPLDQAEAQVQRIFAELEQLAPDTQLTVYSRLLTALSQKLTVAVVSKAISAARVEPQSAPARAATPKKQTPSRKAANDDIPAADSQLRELHDPTDPVEAWQRFGGSAHDLFEVLRHEPMGVLEAMAVHRNMPKGTKPRGKSREKLAENIAVRLEQQFKG